MQPLFSPRNLVKSSLAAVAALLFSGGAQAQEMSCKAVMQRIDSLPKTPHHQFVSMGSSEATRAPISESIATDKAIYVQVNGVWRNTGFSPAEMSQRETETRRHKKSHCTLVREEVFEGADSALYNVTTQAAFGTMDSQLWVSRATGLPLLERYVLDTGTERSYYEVRFVYSGIEAPPGL